MATPPVYLDLRQLVSNLIDWTDPENPVLRTSGSGGGGGGGGDVAVTSIAPGTNNIGKVDIEAALPEGTNTLGHVFIDGTVLLAAGSNLIGKVAQVSLASAPYAAVSVGTSATPLVSAVDDTRKALSIYNNGTTDLYCGPDGSITTSNAPIVIAPGTGTVIEKSDGFARFRWYGIAGTGTIDARVMEGKE